MASRGPSTELATLRHARPSLGALIDALRRVPATLTRANERRSFLRADSYQLMAC